MSTTNTPALTTKALFSQDNVRAKFEEMLGKRAPQFITSVLQIISQNDMLVNADPMTVYNCAAVAATLDLPLNNNLGYAYLVPFNQKQKDGSFKVVAQFLIGAKGFRQLAIRSGQFKTIHETDVREGEIKSHDRLTGIMEFEWISNTEERLKKAIVGYVSHFQLTNGYESTYYMTIAELDAHGKKFSQTFKKGYGLWKDDFHSMCMKTVAKLNISKNAPLSVEMQKAIHTDQAVIKDDSGEKVEYADAEDVTLDQKAVIDRKENDRILDHILKSESLEDLSMVEHVINDEKMKEAYDKKLAELKQNKK